jgi:hypothetical protein
VLNRHVAGHTSKGIPATPSGRILDKTSKTDSARMIAAMQHCIKATREPIVPRANRTVANSDKKIANI